MEILLRQQISDEEKKDYLSIIHEQSHRVQRLVQDLFDLAKMEQGSFSFQWEELSIQEIVTDVLSFVESSMDEKGIYLEYIPPREVLYVYGDHQRLGQVFINILENAKKYTPSGGVIYVRFAVEKQTVTVEIEDTGQGIPSDELPFIMERLYRVEKSRSQETGGSGLGLAISKKIVEVHQGEIRVESTEGKGTTFYIRLPLHSIENLK